MGKSGRAGALPLPLISGMPPGLVPTHQHLLLPFRPCSCAPWCGLHFCADGKLGEHGRNSAAGKSSIRVSYSDYQDSWLP